MKERTFRLLTEKEATAMFELVVQRIAWMDQKGIRQWNVMKYDKVFPAEFYEEMSRREMLFGLFDKKGELLAGGALTEWDESWGDETPALYLHNFVAKVGSGAGAEFLRRAEEYAREIGKTYLRLDSAADNPALGRYYEAQGFRGGGECVDEPYRGILREKNVQKTGKCG